jgi:hypothetical protein
MNRKLGFLVILIIILVLILMLAIRPVDAADTHKFGDFVAKCPQHNIIYRRLPNNSPGAYVPGAVVLDPYVLKREKPIVRKFVFFHECGHGFVGSSEHAADCYAAKHGVRNGWLKETDIEAICLSFAGPETSSHPSGRSRCANIYRCMSDAKKEIASGKAPNNSVSK